MSLIQSTADSLRRRQRHALNQLGIKVFRKTDEWMAHASLISAGPIYDPALFEWTTKLEMAAPDIRSELLRILDHRESLPTFQNISPAQQSISKDDRWQIFAFYGFGERSARNCELCPMTAKVLDSIPGVFNAFFSILAPGKHIPRHCGVTKGFVRCHLGLIVPQEREKCRMNVDGSLVFWEEGKAVVFDDSRPHEVWNDTDETRVVLLVDVPRPMQLHGRMLLSTLMTILRRTFYVQEPIANQLRWERQTADVFERKKV